MSEAANLDQRFATAMGQLLGPDFPTDIALGVSGGGDSMAMLALAHNWARVWGVKLWVVTVDHGLRAESADEAAMVARECETLGHPHVTLHWQWDGQGNVQDAARRARLDLFDEWRAQVQHILLAHTADDVAETFLMRLARGSGVAGLAAMQAARQVKSKSDSPSEKSQYFKVIRPCLAMKREELRHYARTLHVPWVEDPSNADPRFDRVKMREALPALAEIGLTADRLRETADRLRRAEEALHARVLSVADHVLIESLQGVVQLDRDGFAHVERDTQLRLFAAACMWISNAEYRPRAEALDRLLDTVLSGGTGTLSGAIFQCADDRVLVFREQQAVQGRRKGHLWDGRWQLNGPNLSDLEIGALGDAVTDCPDWRGTGQPRAALMASPAVWDGEMLIAAPMAGYNPEYTARIVTEFRSFLLSH